jgi:hypothetical protein
MASLDSTERAKVALAAGESLIVTTTGQCTVQGLTGAPATTTTVTASTRTFGPYGVSAVLLVTNVSGRTDYGADNATYALNRTEKAAFDGLVSGAGISAPSALFANLPAAADNLGNVIRVTDVGGAAGSLWISDGTDWAPVNGECMLLSTVIPFVKPPNGSMAANGALTLGKALDFTYSAPASGQGGCWMYFAAGQVHSGSAAGWWYTVMSSTTAGTVYNNRYTSGPTNPPAIPAGLSIAGPGAFTADAGTDRSGPTVTLPGNAMGRFGRLRSRTVGSASATGAGSRFHKAFLGGYAFQVTTITTANTYSSAIGEVGNTGYPLTQRGLSYNDGSGLIGNAAYTPSTGSTDTTADSTVSIALRNSSGADWLVLHAGDIFLMR